ncbi:MAG: hypothetical protein EON94_09705, partial [Caulobacteraceae bacterium]
MGLGVFEGAGDVQPVVHQVSAANHADKCVLATAAVRPSILGAHVEAVEIALGDEVHNARHPVGLIDRVEVLTGGASAIYGADGVSGVVNFITKRDFDGL